MTIGPTINVIRKEIQNIITRLPDVDSAFGFGSFFRSEPYNDIDLLFVLKSNCASNLLVFYDLQRIVLILEDCYQVRIDFTVLTQREFGEGPLRDMDSLLRLST